MIVVVVVIKGGLCMKKLVYAALIMGAWSVGTTFADDIAKLEKQIDEIEANIAEIDQEIAQLENIVRISLKDSTRLTQLRRAREPLTAQLRRLNLALTYEKAGFPAEEYVVGGY